MIVEEIRDSLEKHYSLACRMDNEHVGMLRVAYKGKNKYSSIALISNSGFKFRTICSKEISSVDYCKLVSHIKMICNLQGVYNDISNRELDLWEKS